MTANIIIAESTIAFVLTITVYIITTDIIISDVTQSSEFQCIVVI
jgi:hypothetical protein